MADTFLELNDDIGVAPDGSLEPIVTIGATLIVPAMRDGHPMELPQTVEIKPIAGTRIVKTDDPQVIEALRQTGNFHEVKPPTKTELSKQRDKTQDAREKAGTHVDPEENES